ncbi:MAG: PilN domain-containing protein [Candidatus Omnitrophica bacterium]|jgi:Tfp pilus assembly protein PilO|nr:PilN domain-containing protein [Candidatus Omnitrophota bacterium]
MIEIDLLPEELKLNRKKSLLNIQSFLYIIPLIIGILIFVHVIFFCVQIFISGNLFTLQNKWKMLEKDRKSYEDFKKEFDSKNMDTNALQAVAGKYSLWAGKLDRLGLSLPSGVWFTDISVSQDTFILKASVVSLDKDEVSLINEFLTKIKEDADFMSAFTNIELGAMQRRQISSYDIVDFTISGKLK